MAQFSHAGLTEMPQWQMPLLFSWPAYLIIKLILGIIFIFRSLDLMAKLITKNTMGSRIVNVPSDKSQGNWWDALLEQRCHWFLEHNWKKVRTLWHEDCDTNSWSVRLPLSSQCHCLKDEVRGCQAHEVHTDTDLISEIHVNHFKIC